MAGLSGVPGVCSLLQACRESPSALIEVSK